MKVSRLTLLAPVLGALLITPATMAADTSLSQSSWTVAPVQIDPNLRDPLLQRGQAVFLARCVICHGGIPEQTVPGGLPSMPGTQALQLRYQGAKPALLEARTDLTPEFITAIVRNGINSMPYFRPTEVSDADLDALGNYLARNKQ